MSRIDAALDEMRAFEALALRKTRLAGFDARAKVLVTAVFIVTIVSFDRYAVAALLPLTVFPVVLAAMGEVPGGALLRKLIIASPFALMVGIFNPWIDTAPALAFGSSQISAGWLSFASIMLRFALTVSAALILVAATGMNALCVALRQMGLPRVLTTQMLFLHRYAFVLGGEAARTTTARRLRAGDGGGMGLAVYGSMVGHLLLRAFERAHRLHQAMVARGFDGEVRSMRSANWQWRDTAFVVAWCAFFFAARAIDISSLLGTLVGARWA